MTYWWIFQKAADVGEYCHREFFIGKLERLAGIQYLGVVENPDGRLGSCNQELNPTEGNHTTPSCRTGQSEQSARSGKALEQTKKNTSTKKLDVLGVSFFRQRPSRARDHKTSNLQVGVRKPNSRPSSLLLQEGSLVLLQEGSLVLTYHSQLGGLQFFFCECL